LYTAFTFHISQYNLAAMKKIILVDDNEGIRETVAAFLVMEGYEVVTASDGHEALKKLEDLTELPEVIFLDLWMPGLDGFAFRARQLAQPRIAHIPVVIMTGDILAGDQEQLLNPAGVLLKPFNLDDVPKILQDTFNL
jgi:CheY-like chemotaxis protein